MSVTDGGFLRLEINGKELDVDLKEQNIVKVTDRSGNSIHYQMVDGVYFSPIHKTRLIQASRNFSLRPDDVYFPGYLRTGTHWTFELTSMLLIGKAETIPRFKEHMELVPPEDFDKLPSPRVISCHLPLSHAPEDVRRKKVKVIYTLRDPRDVAVSLYNLYYNRPAPGGAYMGSFEDYLHLFMAGTVDHSGIFNHYLDAEKFFEENPDVPVHFQIYEETIKYPVQSVRNLSDFLGLPRNEDLCKAIADKCEFAKMKVDKEDYSFKIGGENIFLRKGTAGEWKDYFTEDMLDDYFRFYDEKMAGSRFYDLYARHAK